MKNYSYLRKAILRELSHNSRASITELSKKIKCSRNSVISNMEAMEKEIGLKYTLQFNRGALGISQNQFWLVNFEKKPSPEELASMFKNDDKVRFAAMTDRDFDLLINIITFSHEEYSHWAIKTLTKLLKYEPTIKAASIIANHIGFIPVPNDTIEKCDFGKLKLDEVDKKIIMLLNDDARMTYDAIAKALKENKGTIRYRVNRILKSGLIFRFTITVTKPPTPYNAVFYMNFNWTPGFIKRYDEARQYYVEEKQLPLINTFQYLALSSGSFLFIGMGCFEDSEKAESAMITKHKELFAKDKPQIATAKITEVIKGNMPIRNINMKEAFDPLVL